MKYALLLAVVVVGFLSAIGYAKKAGAQELTISTVKQASTTTIGDSAVVVPATITVEDMSLEKFKALRIEWRNKLEVRKWEKARRHAPNFSQYASAIDPWLRYDTVLWWKNKAIYWKYHNYLWRRFNNNDFDWILERAARKFSVSYSHIHGCSHHEGNNHDGPPIYNNEGSGAYGWMQFMPSTFYNNVGSAFYVARIKGMKVPTTYRYASSRVGQAITAAYMFSRGWSSQWTGEGC